MADNDGTRTGLDIGWGRADVERTSCAWSGRRLPWLGDRSIDSVELECRSRSRQQLSLSDGECSIVIDLMTMTAHLLSVSFVYPSYHRVSMHPLYQIVFLCIPSINRVSLFPSLRFGGKYNPGSGETLNSVVEQWSRVRSLTRNSAPFRGVVLRPPLFSSQCAANLAIPFLPPPPSHHRFPSIYCRRYPPVNRLLPRRLSLPDLPPWFRRASRSSGTLCAPPRSARPRTEPPRLSAARRRHLRCRSAEALAPLPQLPCTHCSHTVDKPLPPVIYLATLHSVREHHISTFGDARYLRALIARRSVDRIAALVAAAAAVAPALLVSPVLARAAAALGAARTRRARC